ncbi:MAG: DNA-binding response regulator [Betaproteobacteria bacterium RIFCSPLOWO2_12_FULL_62_58]|nr:MAG: DNA-binding response regulator [Betaproteobacteria bacterium RIFCSPLOWO2_12_FULL_62_58]
MTDQDHVLVVDDDQEIRSLLRDYLQKNGYRVTAVGDGKRMWAAFEEARPDIVVLDLMLPGDDGLTLCRDLRARSKTPIIMLTARGEETDRIVGLEMGADDYLPKPFNPRELLARIKSILRRTRTLPENLRPEDARAIRFAGWTLDVATRNLRSPEGVVVALSGTEYKLLRIFLAHANRVLNRDQLIDLMLSRDASPFDRSIDVQVSRLRHRLGEGAKEPAIIKTVRGEGYVLSVPVEVGK